MAYYKRQGIYHCDFTINGQRYRQTLETTDWREAKKREDELKARAGEGKLASGITAEFSRLFFDAAADRYLAEVVLQRPGSLRPAAQKSGGDPRKSWEGDLIERLRPFFRCKRLNQITADDVRAYQAERIGRGKHPNTVNHEVKALLRLLKRAKLLSRIRDDVKLLRVKKEPKTMLTEAEKQRLFETASSNPEWQTAYWAALLTANSTMRPVELRRLLWRDIDPFQKLVTVRRSKTDAGSRVIPLNPEAWNAIAGVKARADSLGTYAPENYVFHRLWPRVEPGQPMGGWRSAWRSLRKAAGAANHAKGWEEVPKLSTLRFYDLRHQAITEMLEAGVPEGVIREIAGHVDPAMTMHYSHPRLAARRAAVETLMNAQTPDAVESHVTNHVTMRLTDGVENPQVIESIGTPGVIRTPDPLLRRQVLYPAELRAHAGAAGVAGLRLSHWL
jgi:integrase